MSSRERKWSKALEITLDSFGSLVMTIYSKRWKPCYSKNSIRWFTVSENMTNNLMMMTFDSLFWAFSIKFKNSPSKLWVLSTLFLYYGSFNINSAKCKHYSNISCKSWPVSDFSGLFIWMIRTYSKFIEINWGIQEYYLKPFRYRLIALVIFLYIHL